MTLFTLRGPSLGLEGFFPYKVDYLSQMLFLSGNRVLISWRDRVTLLFGHPVRQRREPFEVYLYPVRMFIF